MHSDPTVPGTTQELTLSNRKGNPAQNEGSGLSHSNKKMARSCRLTKRFSGIVAILGHLCFCPTVGRAESGPKNQAAMTPSLEENGVHFDLGPFNPHRF